MNWQTYLRFLTALFGVCFQPGSSSEEPLKTNTTAAPPLSDFSNEDFTTPCYVQKSKVLELIIAMNKTVRILNMADKYLECHNLIKFAEPEEPGTIEFCSETRISMIAEELDEVAGRLFQLAIRLEEPSEAEVDSLNIRKFSLIDALTALRVVEGTSPCSSSSMALYPLRPLVEYLEYSLNNIIAIFLQGPRPIRPNNPGFASHQTGNAFSPLKSFTQLYESASLNPAAMSRALPQLIQQLLIGNNDTDLYYKILEFVQALPTIENQIIGFRAVHEHVKSDLAEELQMTELSEYVNKLVSESVPTCSPIRQKLDDLIHDLSPVKLIGKKANCQVTNVAYQKQLCRYDTGWPESTYLCSPTWTWTIEPKAELGKLVYRIRGTYPLFAAETNMNQYNQYQTNDTESYVLHGNEVPQEAEVNWTLVPVRGTAVDRFKIMTSDTNGTLFAHKSAMNWVTYRRVLVAKNGFEETDFDFQADQWTLTCLAG